MPILKMVAGIPYPMGASVTLRGVNFALFSRNATSVVLELYESSRDSKPFKSIRFDPVQNRTGDVWHMEIQGIGAGVLYLYRVDGPAQPAAGFRFDFSKHLFDPCAKAFSAGSVFKSLETDDMSLFPKCIVIDESGFDWKGDHPLNIPLCDSVIYEAHLRGYTVSPTSGVSYPGTYRGFIEKIPYLKKLGITAVELLPVQEFDENENRNENPRTGERLKNYWGYSTIGFFAPKESYAADRSNGACVNEFREMVRQLHLAGIEIILDVVYNHTAEGNEHGYTFEFRGLENNIYYMLEEKDRQFYSNFSGCGNTFNTNHPVVRSFIIDSLRYWVTQMHVDGFRFDLASVFSRAQNGMVVKFPPLPNQIAEDPVLRSTKIIAEPWDAAGTYQAGSFPGGRWSEWNDRFRNEVRRFIRGDESVSTAAATRYAGSSDMYRDRGPETSVNYITVHDGFTMNDLVSYTKKHNEENGEGNRDGSDDSLSYNYGFEGETKNPKIEALRNRQIKNFILGLFISQGVPLFLAGDEFRRTQLGNNNAYCQDNEISWVNWENEKKYRELVRFTQKMMQLRRTHQVFRRKTFFKGGSFVDGAAPDIMWYDADGKIPDWQVLNRFLAGRLEGNKADRIGLAPDNDFYIASNMDLHDMTVILPPLSADRRWVRVVDTSAASPDDIRDPGDEEILASQNRYVLLSGSAIILMSRKTD
jgi:isoamylase